MRTWALILVGALVALMTLADTDRGLDATARSGAGFGVMSPPEKGARDNATRLRVQTWHDGHRQHRVYVNPERVLVFAADAAHATRQPHPDAVCVLDRAGMAIWATPALDPAATRSLDVGAGARVSICLHAGPDTGAQPLGLPGGIFLRLAEEATPSDLLERLATMGLPAPRAMAYDETLYFVDTPGGIEDLERVTVLAGSPEVASAEPNWWRGGGRR